MADIPFDDSLDPPDNTIAEALGQPLILTGGMSIDDAINMHLVDCTQCRGAYERGRPRGLGQRSGHCGTYWHLQMMRADYEGKINNVVAHTEYGDEAPNPGQLQSRQMP